MSQFLNNIIEVKRQEVAVMSEEVLLNSQKRPSLFQTVRNQPAKIHVIAEVKRASPSKGEINLNIDPVAQALLYEAAGASAISVLTDEQFFKGSLADLQQIATVVQLPILCKDFMIDEKQVIRAKNAGASIILLIVSALKLSTLKHLFQFAHELELEVLVEVHDLEELKIAEAIGATLIGVNNRNLATFDVSLEVSHQLGPDCQTDACYFSESGIRNVAEVSALAPHFHGVLVGETLMRAEDPKAMTKALQVKR